MTTTPSAMILGLALSLVALGCNNSSSAAQTSAPATSQSGDRAAAGKVVKVVFVGEENACDCTRKRVDATWAALQKALGTPTKFPVERLQMDTQEDKVEPYRQQRAVMALPAVYFVDSNNQVIELLQGEVTEEQISSALKG